jgi:hypothetical protein
MLGIEIALAVYGLFGLIGGVLITSRTKVVQGLRARLLGALALVPLAAGFGLIFLITKDPAVPLYIRTGVVAVVAVAVFVIGARLGVNPDAQPASAAGGFEEPRASEEPLDSDDAEPDLVLTDAQPTSTGPESEHLDYFDTIAAHLESPQLNPENLDYFDTKVERTGAHRPDPLDDVDPEPPRPGTRS